MAMQSEERMGESARWHAQTDRQMDSRAIESTASVTGGEYGAAPTHPQQQEIAEMTGERTGAGRGEKPVQSDENSLWRERPRRPPL